MYNSFEYNKKIYNNPSISPTALNIIINTRTVLGANLAGNLLISPVLHNIGSTVMIPQIDTVVTTGDVTTQVEGSVPMLYRMELSDLFTFTISSTVVNVDNTNLGVLLRQNAALPVSSVSNRTITGNIANLLGEPVSDLYIRISVVGVNLAGHIVLPKPVVMPIDSGTGAVTISVPPTADYLASAGGTIVYEIVRNLPSFPLVGRVGFTVPSTAGPFTFSTSNGSIIVV